MLDTNIPRPSETDPRSLSVFAEERLREALVHGRFAVGDVLPSEQKLAALFGVSRTVVREALSALRAEGLISTHRGRGAKVVNTTASRIFRLLPEEIGPLETIQQTHQVRILLEPEAAALAALHADRETKATISRLSEEFSSAIEDGNPAFGIDSRFHFEIARATGNAVLAESIHDLGTRTMPRKPIPVDEHPTSAWRKRVSTLAREHQAISDAIQKGNARAARRAMRRHIQTSINNMSDALTEREPL